MKLRRFKRIQKMKGNLVVGVGWYQENQWALLLEHAEDKEELEPTYIEWLGACRFSKHSRTKTPNDLNQILFNS